MVKGEKLRSIRFPFKQAPTSWRLFVGKSVIIDDYSFEKVCAMLVYSFEKVCAMLVYSFEKV